MELMDAAGAFDSVPATDDYSAGDRITRYYCFIVLLQYILLSVPLYRYFSEPPALTEFPDDPAMKNQTNSTGFCAFMWEVLSVSDFLLGAPEKRVSYHNHWICCGVFQYAYVNGECCLYCYINRCSTHLHTNCPSYIIYQLLPVLVSW